MPPKATQTTAAATQTATAPEGEERKEPTPLHMPGLPLPGIPLRMPTGLPGRVL